MSLLVAGCSIDGDGSDGANPDGEETPPNDSEAMNGFALTSPAFEDRERIPSTYGDENQTVNPPLRFENVPDDAESLALAMDDPDAVEPAGKVWDHWVVWNSPPDREHTYRFRAYALDTTLELPTETDVDRLESETDGHVLERAHLERTYPA
jgi:phosphatidylethanolamine-binding protein (PEBP) family uncharacterized protein